MIKPGEIQKRANLVGVRDQQIEKDYILSWILWGVANHEQLSKILVFKGGGTVLKKVYFSIVLQMGILQDEALKSVIDFGFSKLNLYKIEAFTHKANENSIRLLENNRFRFIENRKDEDNANNIIFEIEKPVAVYSLCSNRI